MVPARGEERGDRPSSWICTSVPSILRARSRGVPDPGVEPLNELEELRDGIDTFRPVVPGAALDGRSPSTAVAEWERRPWWIGCGMREGRDRPPPLLLPPEFATPPPPVAAM